LPLQLNRETGSLISNNSSTAATASLRRTRSLGSLHDSIHTRDSEKAPFFEDLVVTNKSRSRILSQIAKVSIQPLTQLVKPSSSRQQQKHHYLSPPPFKTYPTS
jgi:hypothetical protein